MVVTLRNAGKAVPLGAVALVALAFCAAVGAEQFLLFDTTVVHEIVPNPPYSGWHSHLNLVFAPGVPTNWNSPVDYYNGTSYSRFDVMEKPSDRKDTYQYCINRAANLGGEWHTCTGCVDMFTEPAVSWWEESPSKFWFYQKPNYGNFVNGYPQLVLKSNVNGGCDCPVTSAGLAQFHCWDGYPDMNLHYPMKLHATVYIVSKDGTFEPPQWWNDSVPGGKVATAHGRIAANKRPLQLAIHHVAPGTIRVDGIPAGLANIELVLPDGSLMRKQVSPADGSVLVSGLKTRHGVAMVRVTGEKGIQCAKIALVR